MKQETFKKAYEIQTVLSIIDKANPIFVGNKRPSDDLMYARQAMHSKIDKAFKILEGDQQFGDPVIRTEVYERIMDVMLASFSEINEILSVERVKLQGEFDSLTDSVVAEVNIVVSEDTKVDTNDRK